MGVHHRHRAYATGVLLAFGIVTSCDDEPVTSVPVETPDAGFSLQWSIDAQPEGFVGVEEAGRTVVAVSNVGTYDFDGSTWNRVGDGIAAHDIALAPDGSLFALKGLSLHRRDGTTWTSVRTFELTSEYPSVPAVWAHSSNHVFVITTEYDDYWYFYTNTLHHFDGASWRAYEAPGFGAWFNDMWGTSPTNVYIASSDGLYRFDGNAVTKVEAAGSAALRMVGGTSETDIYAIRSDQSVLQFDGYTFTNAPAPTTQTLFSAHRIAGDLFVCGARGACYRYVGGAWQATAAPARDDFHGVWGSSTDDIFAVGSGGILRLSSGVWRRAQGGAPVHWFGVWVADTGEVFAVGEGGVVETRDAVGWRPMVVAAQSATLYDVTGTSSTDVYAVGEGGTIVHFDGAAMTPMTSGTTASLYGVWASGETVVAVGSGIVLELQRGAWTPMNGEVPQRFVFQDVWGTAQSNIFAVGYPLHTYEGGLFHYDGTAWSEVELGLTKRLYGVVGFGPDDVFAVGLASPQDGPTRYWAGTILHYDGNAWSRMWVREDIPSMESVWGASPTDLIALSTHDAVSFDGERWQLQPLEGLDEFYFSDIHGVDRGNIYAVGRNGIIRVRMEQ